MKPFLVPKHYVKGAGSMARQIERTVRGTKQFDGAGVKLLRVLGLNTVKDFDPFLMLDFFDSADPDDYTNGFPWHPHRGIETVTYLIEGEIEHGDSLNNKGSILPGSCQWMTAGSGIIHQEMPAAAERMLGVQLWINLPAKDKMTKPSYRNIKSSMIKKVEEENAKIAIISGKYKGVKGAIEGGYVKTLYLDVQVNPDSVWSADVKKNDTAFAFMISGSCSFGGSEFIDAPAAVLLTKDEKIEVKSGRDGARFLLLSAKPLKEPVAWGGPIVMNTHDELNNAFTELDQNTFIKEKHPEFKH